MYPRQLVLCLFMGFQFNTNNNILNAFPISRDTESSAELYTDINQSTESESLEEIVLDLSHLDSSYFGVPDESMNERLLEAQREAKELGREFYPEISGTYLEGDLLMPINKSELLYRGQRLSIRDRKATLWPNGVVPYKISREFNEVQLALIHAAIAEYHARTCIRFRKHTTERDYVYFTSRTSGCYSRIGRTGDRQDINLARPFCLFRVGTILHEIMHALGFLHEQSRYDRDEYVKIMWDNIQKRFVHNFIKSKRKEYIAGFVYDFGSIMHYPPYAFAKDSKKNTIETLDRSKQKLLGQRVDFSPDDLLKINTRYRCKMLKATHNADDDVGLFFKFHSGNVTIDIDYNADDIDY